MTRLGELLRMDRVMRRLTVAQQAAEMRLTKSTLLRIEQIDMNVVSVGTYRQIEDWLWEEVQPIASHHASKR